MTARLSALAVLMWALGFGWFALLLPQPLDGRTTDAIVVLTGGDGRLDRGLDLMRDGATDAELTSAIAHIWNRRTDRYSELRNTLKGSARPKVEMSYIGG